jgi:hypothetical protein
MAWDLNPRPRRCERRALPTELAAHFVGCYLIYCGCDASAGPTPPGWAPGRAVPSGDSTGAEGTARL